MWLIALDDLQMQSTKKTLLINRYKGGGCNQT